MIAKQKVSCHNGQCFREKEGMSVYFDELFDDSNIVDRIEEDLLVNSLYGNRRFRAN